MKLLSFFLSFLLLIASVLPSQADEAGAKRVTSEYEREAKAWIEKVNAAQEVEEKRELWASVPDANEFGEDLLGELDGSWDKDWFLDYAPTLLNLAPEYSVNAINKGSRTPLSAIREAADSFHFESSKIGPLCLALVIDIGPSTRAFLEKVEANHPDKRVQGQAAMALALLSQALGDGGNVAQFKQQRLNWVRKAIIESTDAPVGNSTVGEMADDFLFRLQHLEKGMQAPDILGRDIQEQALRLRDFQGKPVMIVFWHSRMRAFDETMEFVRKVEGRLGPRGLVIVGVANEDNGVVREMVKDGSVTWQNWLDRDGRIAKLYQVTDYPACWVVDAEGKVQFHGVPGAFAELTAEALVKELEKK